jgi:hypothetical protein
VEVVHLAVQGAGVPYAVDATLHRRRLQVDVLQEHLATNGLRLAAINGCIATTDEAGYTVQVYGATVTVEVAPHAGASG